MYVLFSAIVLLLTVSFSSCKKEKDFISSNSGGAKLVFNVSSQIGSVHSNKLATVQPSTSQATSPLAIGNRVSLFAKTEENTARKSLISKETKFDKKIASSSLVHDYTRYRILLFNVTTNKIEQSVEAEAGESLALAVTAGDVYKWYAYSYNTLGRIDTPEMVNNVPVIRTLADKEFLWASSGTSTITPTGNTNPPIPILFEHKMAEFVVEIDIADLHGKISDLRIDLDDPGYFNTAEINLETGLASDPLDYPVPELSLDDFEYDLSVDSTILRAKFYTAVPQGKLESVKVDIRKITVIHENSSSNNIHKLEDPAKSVTFAFTNPNVSKSHVAQMKFRYSIPTKRILHAIGYEVNNDDQSWGFAAQPKERVLTSSWTYNANNEFSPFNMIKAPLNFGNLTNSIVQTDGFTHVRSVHNELAAKLTVVGEIPDIVIISVYYYLRPEDITALTTYLNNGGVVIMMTDSATPINASTRPNEVEATQSFFRALFNTQSDEEEDKVTLDYGVDPTWYHDSRLFELDYERNIDDRIINGPFGNLSGNYWGNDSYAVVQAKNLPIGTGANQVTVYSKPQAANSAVTPLGVSMFKHNSKNLFWIGDGSFLSHPAGAASGYSGGWGAEPFATVGAGQPNPDSGGPSHIHYPLPKPYGQDYTHPTLGNVGYSSGAKVYNAPLFANLMAWAVYQSEFFGINRGSLIPAEVRDWNVSGGSVNYDYNQ